MLSDPDGSFDVFVAYRANAVGHIVKVVAALDDEGALVASHPDFNESATGSFTIWPYKVAGERFGLDHWVWWATGPIFRETPRSWADAITAEDQGLGLDQ